MRQFSCWAIPPGAAPRWGNWLLRRPAAPTAWWLRPGELSPSDRSSRAGTHLAQRARTRPIRCKAHHRAQSLLRYWIVGCRSIWCSPSAFTMNVSWTAR